MATIKDIAEKAGVSPSAVSRILNHDTSLSVGIDTKLRVLSAAQDLDYIPRKKRKEHLYKPNRKRLNIAIVEWYDASALIEDPYYFYLMNTVEKLLAKNNINSFRLVPVDEMYVASIDSPVDGIIAIGRFNEDQVKKLAAISGTIVFLDACPDAAHFDSILINLEQGMQLALEYVYAQGHRKIGFIGGNVIADIGMNITKPGFDRRRAAFESFTREKNIYCKDFICIGNSLCYQEGFRLCDKLLTLKNLPTALICANDSVATGVTACLKQKKFNIPADFSIVGFNDIPENKFLQPALTSVKIPVEMVAEVSIDVIRHIIDGDSPGPLLRYIPATLTIRDSVAAI